MSEATVSLILPKPVVEEVVINARLTLREAVILRILLGRTTGLALQKLYDALGQHEQIRSEANRLET